MRTLSKQIVLIVALLVAVGCNGKNNGTTPRGGGGTDGVGGGGGTDLVSAPRPRKRRLSKRAKKAFKKVKKSLERVLKGVASRGGKWTESECRRVAEAFAGIARDNAGERDAVVAWEDTAEIADALPDSRFLKIPDCGHSVLAEGGVETFDRVVDFLQGRRSAADRRSTTPQPS